MKSRCEKACRLRARYRAGASKLTLAERQKLYPGARRQSFVDLYKLRTAEKIARKPKKSTVIYAISPQLVRKDVVVYRVESLLQVNIERPSEKTIIHISTDFIHKKGDSCFSGEILLEARLTEIYLGLDAITKITKLTNKRKWSTKLTKITISTKITKNC